MKILKKLTSLLIILSVLLSNVQGLNIYALETGSAVENLANEERFNNDDLTVNGDQNKDESKGEAENTNEEKGEQEEVAEKPSDVLEDNETFDGKLEQIEYEKENFIIIKYKDYRKREETKQNIINKINELYSLELLLSEIDVVDEIPNLGIELLFFEAGDLSKIVSLIDKQENVSSVQLNSQLKLLLSEPDEPDSEKIRSLENEVDREIKQETIIEPKFKNSNEKNEEVDSISRAIKIGVIDTKIINKDKRTIASKMFIDEEVEKGETHGTVIYNTLVDKTDELKEFNMDNVTIESMVAFGSADNTGYSFDVLKSIDYAVNNDINIINCSFGSNSKLPVLFDIISENRDIAFVLAAGEEDNQLRTELPNVIIVTAIDNEGEVSKGLANNIEVDIATRGSFNNDIDEGTNFGSSIATAIVTKVMAMYLYENPEVTAIEAIEKIKLTAEKINGINTKYGVLDIEGLFKLNLNTEVLPYFEESWLTDNVKEIIDSKENYDMLSEDEKIILLNELQVREDTMAELNLAGFNIVDSITKARIMQQLNINVVEVLEMTQAFKSEKKAQEEAIRLNIYKRSFVILNDDRNTEVLQNLIIKGYSAKNILHAFIVHNALNIPIEELVIKTETKEKIDGPQEEVSNEKEIDVFLSRYLVNRDVIIKYLVNSNTSVSQMEEVIRKYENDNNIANKEENQINFRSVRVEEEKEERLYPASPFTYQRGYKENINLNTGALNYEQSILSLPGKGGHDLNIAIQYDSDETSEAKEGIIPLGNWKLKQNRIIFNDYQAYFQFENGSKYLMVYKDPYYYGKEVNRLDDYPFAGVKVVDDWFSLYPDSQYRAEFASGEIQYFDVYGRMLATKDKYNNIIKYDYRNRKIIDTYNREILIQNTSDSKTLVMPDNSTIKFGVGNDKLVKYTDQLGNETEFKYLNGKDKGKDRWYLNQIVYSTGLITNYNFEEINCYYTYKKYENIGIASKPKWVWREYEENLNYYRVTSREDKAGGVVYNKLTYTYSNNSFKGSLPKISNEDLPTNYIYTTTITDENGIYKVFDFNNDHMKITETEKISSNKNLSMAKYEYTKKVPIKIETTTYSNTNNNSIKNIELFEYDRYGNMTSYWSPKAEGDKRNVEHQTKFTYDDTYNLLLSKTYKKDANTTIVEENKLSITKKAIVGNVVSVNGVVKAKSDIYYNIYGDIIKTRQHLNENKDITTSIEYNEYGMPIKQTTSGYTLYYSYDAMGRPISKADYNGNVTNYAYDKVGRITIQSNPNNSTFKTYYDDVNNTVKTINEAGTEILYKYDEFGQILSVTDVYSKNVINSFKYDEHMRVLKSYDENGTETIYTYDNLNRLLTKSIAKTSYKESYIYEDAYDGKSTRAIKTIEGGSTAPTIKTATYIDKYGSMFKESIFDGTKENSTTYKYDYLGNALEVLTANDSARGYAFTTKSEYDHGGRVIKTTPEQGVEYKTEYDWAGRTLKTIDPKGNISTFEYNDFGSVLKSEQAFDNKGKMVKNYEYDKNGNMLTIKSTNNVPGQATTTSQVKYEYDSINNPTKVIAYNKGNIENYIEYKYDKAGNKTEMRTGDGKVKTTYAYDYLGRLTKTTDPLGQSEEYKYDKAGNIIWKKDKNGNISTNTYNLANRLTKVTIKEGSETSKEFLQYTYSPNGFKLTEENENLKTEYKYDSLGRTISKNDSDGTTRSYTYDLGGNRTGFTSKKSSEVILNTTYVYDKQNRLLNVKEKEKAVATYTYDVFNRLTSTQNNKGETQYTYKADGLRLTKTSDNKTTTHIWDGSNIVAELDGEGTIKDRYIRGIGLISSEKEGYYIYNAHGDVVQLANETGGIIKEYRYDAFGVEEDIDEGDTNPFRYAGEYFDKETGNIYLRARYYTPSIGRFMTEDPIRDGLNWYTYAGNKVMYRKNHTPTKPPLMLIFYHFSTLFASEY